MLLDWSEKQMIEDAFLIGLASKGTISLNDLNNMNIETYLYTAKRAIEICKKMGHIEEK
jgi:hypothetical protein